MIKEINLLLISESATAKRGDARIDGRWHYTAIKSLSRLLASKNSKHKGKMYFCMNCLQGFSTELTRDEHYAYCSNNEAVRVEMPFKKHLVLMFIDGQNQFKVPFVIYADFESILEPIQGCSQDSSNPYTDKVNKHIPSGFWTYSTFAYPGEVKDPLKLYRGNDCVEKFCDHIKKEAYRLYHMFPEKPMDPLMNKQWKAYNRSGKCHICNKKFNLKDPKVRDHCHYTRKYRGPAHRNYN